MNRREVCGRCGLDWAPEHAFPEQHDAVCTVPPATAAPTMTDLMVPPESIAECVTVCRCGHSVFDHYDTGYVCMVDVNDRVCACPEFQEPEKCEKCGDLLYQGSWPYCVSRVNPGGHSTEVAYHFQARMGMKLNGWNRSKV